ncbi:MAG: DUF1273 domain-containing protein [Clostridiales bacterium]|jgi:uncharacterized phage-like protein YoqJ|nr:DUF1273 domain-containing protein [Clostridiales bacterium]
MNKICFSGYRPEKFPFSVEADNPTLLILKLKLQEEVRKAVKEDGAVFYSGMQRGFDILAAEAVLELKSKCENVNLVCVLPFKGFVVGGLWENRFRKLIQFADEIVTISNLPSKWAFLARNDYIVSHAETAIVFYDGKHGGSEYTVRKAYENGLNVINLASVTHERSAE